MLGSGLQRHHGDGLGVDAVLARHDLDRIVHRGAGRGHGDALAGEILDRAHAGVPRRLVTAMTLSWIARPLRALRRDHLQPALGREIVETGGEGGHAEIGVARDDGERHLGGGGEVLEREVDARFLEPALLLGDEDRPGRGQPQERDRRLGEILRARGGRQRQRRQRAQRGAARQTMLNHPSPPDSWGSMAGSSSCARLRHVLVLAPAEMTALRASLLRHAPEGRDRRRHRPGADVGAHGPDAEPFAERHVGDDLDGVALHLLGDRLLLGVASRPARTCRAASPCSSSHGQPARALSQVAARKGVISGSRMSTCDQLVAKAFQPPSDDRPLLRAAASIMLCQSIDCTSTLKPAFSSCALATGPSCLMTPRSVGCSSDDRRAVVARLLQHLAALAALPSTSPSMPASVASGVPQVNIALQVR